MPTVTKTFIYSGQVQLAELPAGVNSVTMHLWGGAGGPGARGDCCYAAQEEQAHCGGRRGRGAAAVWDPQLGQQPRLVQHGSRVGHEQARFDDAPKAQPHGNVRRVSNKQTNKHRRILLKFSHI